MRVSVLVTLPPREADQVLAAENFSPSFGRLFREPLFRKADFVLDRSFSPLPFDLTRRDAIRLEASVPSAPPLVVVRGSIERERLEEVDVGERDGIRIFADPEIGPFRACADTPPIGATSDVERRLNTAGLVARGLDGANVALAIMDTGIDLSHLHRMGLRPKLGRGTAWTSSVGYGRPGSHVTGHGTMCAYDALIAASGATLLDFPILTPVGSTAQPAAAIMSGYLSTALSAYAFLAAAIRRPSWKFRGLVVSNSWGMYHSSWDFPAGHPGRYADNPSHPFNVIVGALARTGADILFASGNCGRDCPDERCQGQVVDTIVGANAHPDVLTVAGCDIRDERAGYSSQGPGIAGMARDKPDLTAYTHFRGSEAFGAGEPDCGTSAACAVAAGCVAALRSGLPLAGTPPDALFSVFRAQAHGKPAPGWNKDYGMGIIRPLAVASHYGF